ncbi:MAG: DUF1329 domain-containing protein [Candidatus Binataceae bacterium]
MIKAVCGLVVLIILSMCPAITLAQETGTESGAPAGATTQTAPVAAPGTVPAAVAADTIPPGTTITMQNWRQYKQFMPEGMAALFQGSYYWKMPSDVQMVVGPATSYPLPKNYAAATEKYGSQVKVVELPDGGLTLNGYVGGRPFRDPSGPHKGWEVLADVWYRYLPSLAVDTYGTGCTQDRYGSINCSADQIVYRQLGFNTDPGVAANVPGAEGKFYTEWVMTVEPEQEKYNASLTISYTDLAKPESVYVFIPSLRRYQPVSSAARCGSTGGIDVLSDDYRFGFDSNMTQVKVDFLGEKKLLMLFPSEIPAGKFPADYDMPLAWPAPSWGKWQLRDAYVISVSKVPAHAAGYCYGKRVMYIDKESSAPVWEDLYDSDMRPWKYLGIFLHPMNVPGVGMAVATGSEFEGFWDIQNKHATYFLDPGEGHPFYLNSGAPAEFSDLNRYTTPSGLNLIMR